MSTMPSSRRQLWTAGETVNSKTTKQLPYNHINPCLYYSPHICLSVLLQCGFCWPFHMQTGTGRTVDERRWSCCRAHTSGKGPHHRRRNQSEARWEYMNLSVCIYGFCIILNPRKNFKHNVGFFSIIGGIKTPFSSGLSDWTWQESHRRRWGSTASPANNTPSVRLHRKSKV